ncbi:MAG: ABC transporter permease [Planctomycetota bacterium]|jgi:Cu-processing system permease protein
MMRAMPQWRTVATIARHELRIVLRSRWVAVYALVFAALTLAVSYFGLTIIEFTGFQEFDRTAVSLLNLILYVVPLATMLMAVQSFREEGGATDQLFTEPVTKGEIVLGKLAGLSMAHLVGIEVGDRGLESYLVLVGFTVLVGMVFLALSALLAILSGRRGRAYAVVLVAWFFLVLLFDLLIIGLSFILPEAWANRVAFLGVFLNPVDATRVATMLAIAGKELFGPAGAQLVRGLGGVPQAVVLLCLTLAAWIGIPAVAATITLDRQDL